MSAAKQDPNLSTEVAKASPQIRILMVLEFLLDAGPSSLKEITDALGMSRSAVFRALKTLETTGWATSNHGSTVYFATDEYLGLARGQAAFPKVLPPLFMLMKHLKTQNKLQVDALYITQTGLLQVVETTDRSVSVGHKHWLISGTRAAAAMATLSPEERLKSAKTALIEAVKEGVHSPRIEGFSRHLRSISRDGYIWGTQRTSLCVPMIDQRGQRGALVLRISKPTLANRNRLEKAVKGLQALCLDNKYPRLGLFRTYEQDATQHLAAQ